MAKKGKAKAPQPQKPRKWEGETGKEFRLRKKAWKREQRLVRKLRKRGIEPDPAYLAALRGEPPPPPPPPHERPIPVPKTREEGGQREDGTYIRRSTVGIDKIEAHLDTIMERDRGMSLKERYKEMFDEDLEVPDGVELIPEREVRVRAGPPRLAEVGERPVPGEMEAPMERELPEEVPSPEMEAVAPPPVAPAPPPMPPPTAPPPRPAPPEPVLAPAPAPAPEPVVEAEPQPEPEAEVEAKEEEPTEAAPTDIEVTPGAVAGVAGVMPGATAAAAGPVVEKRKPPRKVWDVRRYGKIGYWTRREGGSVAKAILNVINAPLYILMFIPGAVITVGYVYKEWKEKKAQREKEAEEYYAQYGGYPPEAYPEGYGYGDQQGAYDYGAEGGYYEGEERYDDRYGY